MAIEKTIRIQELDGSDTTGDLLCAFREKDMEIRLDVGYGTQNLCGFYDYADILALADEIRKRVEA